MPSINIDTFVSVDVEDFLDDCTEKEIEEVIEWLRNNNYEFEQPKKGKDIDEDLIKLLECFSLTNEEEELIKQIANKY